MIARLICAPFLLALTATTPAHADPAAIALCGQNPAFSVSIMRTVIAEQLNTTHDPSLDTESPDQLATDAANRGIADCTADIARNPDIFQALSGLSPADATIGWDAYNVACADHIASKAACIRAEIASQKALRRMSATNTPPGARALVETCALVLPQTPAMAEWRACVDVALAVHAPEDVADACKTTVAWHSAKTGALGGEIVAACLKAATK